MQQEDLWKDYSIYKGVLKFVDKVIVNKNSL